MRYAVTNGDRQIIQPVLPSKPRGVPWVDDRCVLSSILWVRRTMA